MSEKSMEQNNENFMQIFVKGAQKGLNISLNVIMPNVLFAFFLTQILTLSGVMDLIGMIFSPITGLLGLPGEASMPLALTFLSFSGAISSTAALIEAGILTGTHGLIMLPFILLTGSIPSFTGRILIVSKLDIKYYKIIYIITFLGAVLSMIIMRFILN